VEFRPRATREEREEGPLSPTEKQKGEGSRRGNPKSSIKKKGGDGGKILNISKEEEYLSRGTFYGERGRSINLIVEKKGRGEKSKFIAKLGEGG